MSALENQVARITTTLVVKVSPTCRYYKSERVEPSKIAAGSPVFVLVGADGRAHTVTQGTLPVTAADGEIRSLGGTLHPGSLEKLDDKLVVVKGATGASEQWQLTTRAAFFKWDEVKVADIPASTNVFVVYSGSETEATAVAICAVPAAQQTEQGNAGFSGVFKGLVGDKIEITTRKGAFSGVLAGDCKVLRAARSSAKAVVIGETVTVRLNDGKEATRIAVGPPGFGGINQKGAGTVVEGTVQSVKDKALVVKKADGSTETCTLTDKTTVMARTPIKPDAIKAGEVVFATVKRDSEKPATVIVLVVGAAKEE